MIIGITGLTGAGKDTAADFLVKKGFQHYSLSGGIREELKRRGLLDTRENLQQVGIEIREKYGNDALARWAYRKCQKKDCVLSSLRVLDEVKFLKSKSDFMLWAIEAPAKLRYHRLMKRGANSEKTTTSFQKFLEQERKELRGSGARQNLLGVIQEADLIIKNDQTIQIFERRINETLQKVIRSGKH